MDRTLVKTVHDERRGCGWRQPGGLYVRSGGHSAMGCKRMPYPLETCPVCSGGIKPSRSWTWLDVPQLLLAGSGIKTRQEQCSYCRGSGRFLEAGPCLSCDRGTLTRSTACSHGNCSVCPMGGGAEPKTGLLWIGDKFYSPQSFLDESHQMGVSRRLPNVPNDFVAGRTWVLCAHRKGITEPCPDKSPFPHPGDCPGCEGTGKHHVPAIFAAFKSETIEYVVKGTETKEELLSMHRRGIQPVYVERVGKDGRIIPRPWPEDISE